MEKASAEPPLGWSKWASILEMSVFAKDGIEVQNLLRNKLQLIEPAEPNYEVAITGETEEQKKNNDVRDEEKRVGWKNHDKKPEKKEFCVTRSLGLTKKP